MTDSLGPTGNTASVCRYCGEAHGDYVACNHDALRVRVRELRRRLNLIRVSSSLHERTNGNEVTYLVTVPYHDWLEAIGDQP